MSNNSNVNMNSFSKPGTSTYDGEEVGDDGWPFEKSSFGPLCFFCFFPGKKILSQFPVLFVPLAQSPYSMYV